MWGIPAPSYILVLVAFVEFIAEAAEVSSLGQDSSVGTLESGFGQRKEKGGGSRKGPNTRSLHAAMADAARSRLCAVSRRRLSLPSHHTGGQGWGRPYPSGRGGRAANPELFMQFCFWGDAHGKLMEKSLVESAVELFCFISDS